LLPRPELFWLRTRMQLDALEFSEPSGASTPFRL
jgi:hypothetical protein